MIYIEAKSGKDNINDGIWTPLSMKLKKGKKGNHKINPNRSLGKRKKKNMLLNFWFYYFCFMFVIHGTIA